MQDWLTPPPLQAGSSRCVREEPCPDESPESVISIRPVDYLAELNRTRRPIDDRLPEIMQLVGTHKYVIVSGEPGVGKTTGLTEASAIFHPDKGVHVCQHKRIAVKKNGRQIAKEMGTSVGKRVGWKLSREKPHLSEETQVRLWTVRSLINEIRKLGRLPPGILVIDEGDERSIELDILLMLAKEKADVSPDSNVIITSATIDGENFSHYYNEAPFIAVKGEMLPIEDRIELMTPGEHHTETAIRAALNTADSFVGSSLKTPDYQGNPNTLLVTNGSVLMLLPGKEDINQAKRQLKAKINELQRQHPDKKVTMYECHSEAPEKDMSRIEDELEANELRFVVATDIARRSITIPDVAVVIDSLQKKRPHIDDRGVRHFDKLTISRAESIQGRGRGGRTRPSIYMPVSFRNEYNELEPWPKPEILSAPTTDAILLIHSLGFDIRTANLIDKPNLTAIQRGIELLQKLGALDHEGKITDLGMEIVDLPLNPEMGIALRRAEKLGVFSETLIAGTALTIEDIRFIPPARYDKQVMVSKDIALKYVQSINSVADHTVDPASLESDLSLYFNQVPLQEGVGYKLKSSVSINPINLINHCWRNFTIITDENGMQQETHSDFVGLVQAYRAYKQQQSAIRIKAEEAYAQLTEEERKKRTKKKFIRSYCDNGILEWCEMHFLKLKKLKMMDTNIQEIFTALHMTNEQRSKVFESRSFQTKNLTKALACGLVDNIAWRSLNFGELYQSPQVDSVEISRASVCRNFPDFVLYGSINKIGFSRGRHINIMNYAAPVLEEWLEEVLPQLITEKPIPHTLHVDSKTGQVMTKIARRYNNVVLSENEVVYQGSGAAAALADYFFNSTPDPILVENRSLIDEVTSYYSKLGQSFPGTVHLRDAIKQWYQNRIGSATSVKDVQMAHLRLNRELLKTEIGVDIEALQKEVQEKYPDTFQIAGMIVKAEYGSFIRVKLIFDENQVDQALTLTPADIPKIPGYRITLQLGSVSTDYYDDTDLERFKRKLPQAKKSMTNSTFIPDQISMPDSIDTGEEQSRRNEDPYEGIKFALYQPLPPLPQPGEDGKYQFYWYKETVEEDGETYIKYRVCKCDTLDEATSQDRLALRQQINKQDEHTSKDQKEQLRPKVYLLYQEVMNSYSNLSRETQRMVKPILTVYKKGLAQLT